VNVYDFDNTIYDGESGMDLFKYYIVRYPDLLKLAPKVLAGLVRYKRHKISLQEALDSYIPIIEDFLLRLEDPEADLRDFWDRHEHKVKPVFLTLFQEDDLVISASPEIELREICGRLGIKNYLGTVIDEETRKLTHVNFRENKVKYFREKYPDEQIDILFTDSYNDKWLMDISKSVVMIKGDRFSLIK